MTASLASQGSQLAELRLRVSRVLLVFGWGLALSEPFTWAYLKRWPWQAAAGGMAASLVLCLAATLYLRAKPLHPLQRFVVALMIISVGSIWVVVSGGSDAPDIDPMLLAVAVFSSFAGYGCRRVLLVFTGASAFVVLLMQLYFPDLWMVEGANWGRTLWFLGLWICAGALFFSLAGQIHDVLLGQVRSQAELAAARRQEEETRRALEIAEAARRKEELESLHAKGEADRQSAAAHAQFTDAITNALERLSEGDLTSRIAAPLAAEFEPIRESFNSMVDRWSAEMRTVSENAGAIRAGGGEISAAADDLARHSQQQAESLARTAAELGEITQTVERTASGAGRANGVVAATKVDAAGGREIVGRAVAAMGRIEESSRQIEDIIGVIDEIAFQTNLLALNAGVEAARAGDSGKGFAVVASEVRALAQRSAEAARQIKTLISTSTAHVGEGVGLVGQTGAALEQIGDKIAVLTDAVAEIAANADGQSNGLRHINAAVAEVDKITQDNAANIEQTAAASKALAVQAEALAQLVGRYRLSETPTSDLRRPLKAAAPHAFAPPPARPRSTAPLKRAAGGGDWTEF